MDPQLRAILDTIDRYLSGADGQTHYDSNQLWAVLSALRGPDEIDSWENKNATTSVLRAAAFPLTAKLSNLRGGRVHASMVADGEDKALLRRKMSGWEERQKYEHFFGHVTDAFQALKLLWGYSNQ